MITDRWRSTVGMTQGSLQSSVWGLMKHSSSILQNNVPSPPLANSRDSVRRSPGGGGRRSPSDGLPGGGGIARVFQGKLWYPPLIR